MNNNKKTNKNTIKIQQKEPTSYIHPFLQNTIAIKTEDSFSLTEFLNKGILNNTK